MKKQTKIRCGFCGDFLLKVLPHWCNLMGPPSAGMYDKPLNQPPGSDVKDLIREATRLSEEITGIKTICSRCGYTNNSAAVDDHIKEEHSKTKATTEGGLKYDSEKPPIALVPTEAILEIARVLQFGARKYSAHNWRNGISYSRLISAALRHILAFNRGEDSDGESGLSHISHALCCLVFLSTFEANQKTDLDDRYKAESKKEG